MENKKHDKALHIILTIIAILLLLLYLKPVAGITPTLNAQDTNYSLVRDDATAAATKEIADANREISQSIDKLADSVNSVARSLDRIAESINGKDSSVSSAETQTKAKSEENIQIEVKKP